MKRIDELFFCRPWAVKEDYLQTISSIVERHLRGEKLSSDEIIGKIDTGKKEKPGYSVVDGTAIVPVYGVISKRMSSLGWVSQRGTSVQEVRNNLKDALEDAAVSQIILDIDSPGGSSDGVLELSDFIFNSRGKKPILAYADGLMASAAYWIGSAADKVYATRSTDVGSIGVYTVITDWTVWNHNQGLKTEVIRAGRHKAVGHPDRPFSEEDRVLVQSEVNEVYDLFVEAVARNRGMNLDDVLAIATGRTFIGQKALEVGLIDGIDELDNVLVGSPDSKKTQAAASAAGVDINSNHKEGTLEEEEPNMAKITKESLKAENPELAAELTEEGRKAGHSAGFAEGKAAGIEEGKKAGVEEGKKAGVTDERVRVKGIIENSKIIPGSEALVEEAISSGESADASLVRFKNNRLQSIQKTAPETPGPSDSQTDVHKDHVTRAEEYQKEHKCSFIEAMRATAPKRAPVQAA